MRDHGVPALASLYCEAVLWAYSFTAIDAAPWRRARPSIGGTTLTVWDQITTEFYGRRVYGSYVIEDGMVNVKTPRGEKGTQLGGSNPDWLAERLLPKLAAQGKA